LSKIFVITTKKISPLYPDELSPIRYCFRLTDTYLLVETDAILFAKSYSTWSCLVCFNSSFILSFGTRKTYC